MMYTVWRRSDGHVNVSTGSRAPRGWTYRDDDGEFVTVTFDALLVTDDWDAAHARVRAERVADAMTANSV